MSGGEIEFLTEEEDIGFTMSSPTPNKVRVCPEDLVEAQGDLVEEQMERRVASGEFRLASGEVDFVAMTEVMRQLIAQQKEEYKEDVRKRLNRLRYLQHGKRNAGRLQTRPRRRERARAHPPYAGTR